MSEGSTEKKAPPAAEPSRGKRKRKAQEKGNTDSGEDRSTKENKVPPKRRKVAGKVARSQTATEKSSPNKTEPDTAAESEVAGIAADGPSRFNIFALGFEEVAEAAADKTKGRPPIRADRSSLQAKMESGRANENYIKVNIKKKTFVRGRRGGGAAALRAEARRKIDLKVTDIKIDNTA